MGKERRGGHRNFAFELRWRVKYVRVVGQRIAHCAHRQCNPLPPPLRYAPAWAIIKIAIWQQRKEKVQRCIKQGTGAVQNRDPEPSQSRP